MSSERRFVISAEWSGPSSHRAVQKTVEAIDAVSALDEAYPSFRRGEFDEVTITIRRAASPEGEPER